MSAATPEPLDLAELQRLCEIPRPTPTYRTGSGSFTPEFERDWERFAQARRDMANAVPQLVHELTTLRARELNYLSFGQGGADYAQSQLIDRIATLEQERDRLASALAAVREQNARLRNEIGLIIAVGKEYGVELKPSWIERLEKIVVAVRGDGEATDEH